MRGKPINLFMWAYQPHFRSQCEHLANGVIEELGLLEAWRFNEVRPRPHDRAASFQEVLAEWRELAA